MEKQTIIHKYIARVHAGDPRYTDADSIYRVSRKKIKLNSDNQGSGEYYLGMDGKWYHKSVLREFNNDGSHNSIFNEEAARIMHIPLEGGNN